MSDIMLSVVVQYDKISQLPQEVVQNAKTICVVLNEKDPSTIIATLVKNEDGSFQRTEHYASLKEFSTIAMKELLTLYAKRTIIESDTSYYNKDDAKLHAFLSKLSFIGIEHVCKHTKEFSGQFKAGSVSRELTKSKRWSRNKPIIIQ